MYFICKKEEVIEMIRKIIKIDEDKCNGCGACVSTCHEGAIGMVNGKAVLLRDDYCDGLGNCMPVCPCGAITFEEREAAVFDKEAAKANMQKQEGSKTSPVSSRCPGTMAKPIIRNDERVDSAITRPAAAATVQSCLKQWPVQMRLIPPMAPYLQTANLLVTADCCAYAYGNFHNDYMNGKITIMGCPKLDGVDYADKLTDILKTNEIKSVTLTRMEVPCCEVLEQSVKNALRNCRKMIPWQVAIISTDGEVVDD
jgi:NAD-dependent dihydropyrimidine dehydrogenase PreA subunit